MTEDKFDLSRRKVLGSLGVVGAGAALGGAGTAALFNDEERSTGNSMTAGQLDLAASVDYSHNMGVIGGSSSDENVARMSINDIKPGDDGWMKVCFTPQSNPAWVWMQGEVTTDSDNNNNEPEREAEGGQLTSGGELGDTITATLQYDDDTVITEGTLNEVIGFLNDGFLLDSDPSTPDTDNHFAPDTERCVKLVWNVDREVGNEIQGDEVKFDLGLYAVQRRHNSSPNNPYNSTST